MVKAFSASIVDSSAREEREAFLPSAVNAAPAAFVTTTRAVLKSTHPGDNNATDEEDLETNFYKSVVVGAELEFGEISVGEEAVAKLIEENDDPMHRKVYHISAIIFHYTKYYFSFFLFLILGPILSFAWAIVISFVKFSVSWVFYPLIKLCTILCRPTRILVRIMLWPGEPVFETLSRCCPVIYFSLWSVKSLQENSDIDDKSRKKNTDKDKESSSNESPDRGATNKEPFNYIKCMVDQSETETETIV